MQGLRICITGNGKGKTTAAMGMVLRAIGHRKRVLIVQCMKNQPSGELNVLADYPEYVTVKQIGAGFCFVDDDRAEHIRKAKEAVAYIEGALAHESPQYDLIVLDEVLVLTRLRLVTVKDVLRLISLTPESVHLVLTGRYAPQKVRDVCDTVSEIKEVKHHFHNGVSAQEIIEF